MCVQYGWRERTACVFARTRASAYITTMKVVTMTATVADQRGVCAYARVERAEHAPTFVRIN